MKFSIRELLLVTVIVALAVGWWIEYRRSNLLKARLEGTEHDVMMLEKAVEGWNKVLENIERQLPAHGLRVQWTHENPLVVPTSSAPAPNPPKE